MRIFQVFDESGNTSVPNNNSWYRNLYEPLRDLGCDVTFLSAAPGRIARQTNDARLRGRFSEQLLDLFRREHKRQPFDLFFAYLTQGMVEPGVIDEIRKSGVPTCNFSCNNIHQFHLVEHLAPRFDYCLHSEKEARDKFLRVGARPVWWPMASNPTYFHPMSARRTYDVTFVGGAYALRSRYIYQLLERDIAVDVFGPGWRHGARSRLRASIKRNILLGHLLTASSRETRAARSGALAAFDFERFVAAKYSERFHDPLSDDEAVLLYSQTTISLGFLEVYDRHDSSRALLRHMHLRDFEAPMCGALYCTGFTTELAELFEPDREVIVYRNDDELVDKLRFYLSHPENAERVRQAGLRRALAEHTYQIRYKALFAEIGLAWAA
jgi:spore maturation protein CgeB